jgi:mannose/cellobiose epimerase-like protein (N-acyl-D-glucosamine 2-epimerase family)
MSEHIDTDWFRSLALDLLSRWLDAADTDEGLFLPQLDRQWRRIGEPEGTVVSQTRLLHNFAIANDLTDDDRYRDAVVRGARFLLDGFRDHEHGGWFHAVGPGAVVRDDHKNSYDHAFVILGFAHATRITGEPDFRAAMLEAWEILDRRFRDERGGFMRYLTRDFAPREMRRTQNPTMHLFEALLAAGQVEPEMLAEAEKIGRFVLGNLVRWDGQPCMPEFFDLDWRPLSAAADGRVVIGHQFEWAWLLSCATERGLPGWWVAPATDLLQFGLRHGLSDGGSVCTTDYDGTVIDAEHGWWEQCELIRALMHHAVRHGRSDLWPVFYAAVTFAKERCVDDEFGGWLSQPDTDPTDTAPAKGSGTKVDYHVIGMCAEAIRLGGE